MSSQHTGDDLCADAVFVERGGGLLKPTIVGALLDVAAQPLPLRSGMQKNLPAPSSLPENILPRFTYVQEHSSSAFFILSSC